MERSSSPCLERFEVKCGWWADHVAYFHCSDSYRWTAPGKKQSIQRHSYASGEMSLPWVAQQHRSFFHVAPKYFQWNGEIRKVCYFFLKIIWSLLQQFQCTVLQITANVSHLADESYAEIQVNKVDTSYANMGNSLAVWPMVTVAQKDLVNFLHLYGSKWLTVWYCFSRGTRTRRPGARLLVVEETLRGAQKTWSVSLRTCARLPHPRSGGCLGWAAKKKWWCK